MLVIASCAKPAEKEIEKETEQIGQEIIEVGQDIEQPEEIQMDEEVEEILEETDETEVEETGNTIIILETNKGKIKVKLFDELVPITAGNFKKLVEEGFYDGIKFHRVIKDFMIQGGDPEGTGRGGPGYTIKDEFSPELRHDRKGLLSMANAGPNTGGSQFFITLVPTPWLDDKHAIFGEVIEGMDVVDAIGAVPTLANDKPKEDVVIEKAYVV